MFLVTQFIGMYVVNYYSSDDNELPYNMEPPQIEEDKEFYQIFPSILIAFVLAIALFFLITHFKIEVVMKIWFFLVITIALGLAINSFLPKYVYASWIALGLAFVLAFFKVIKRNIIVHNATELLVYPGIAAVFVPLLNLWTMIFLLVLISIYDMWAVWKSGLMQKMAKFQMDKLKIFGGFFVPYLDKKTRAKLRKARKSKSKSKSKTQKVKVNMAILGGGDIIFPIIASGVMLKFYGFWEAVLVVAGATLGLSYLFFVAKKKKFYPAMPFISAGIFLGMAIGIFLL